MSETRVCAVVGVGPGNGAAIARRFAQAGYAVALIARGSEFSQALAREFGNGAGAYACNVADPDAVTQVFARIAVEMGRVDVVSYNAGSGVWGSVDDVDVDAMTSAWRINTLGLFATARAVGPAMKTAGRGAIVVTGATASVRGGAGTAAFASAKAAQRSLVQSIARQWWPQGIHVALIIVDGFSGEKTKDLVARRRRRDRALARAPAPVRVVARSRGAAVRREVVKPS